MRIAFIYDDQMDYNLPADEYADFCVREEADAIVNALISANHSVTVFKGKEQVRNFLARTSEYDIVFNKMEGVGSRNREGLLPALLEMVDMPYTGTDSYGFSLSLNKYHSKLIASDVGVPTPEFVVIRSADEIKKVYELEFPIIIKPNNEGSSMGCSIIRSKKEEIDTKIAELLEKYSQPVIAEHFISGIDISVPLIGNGKNVKCLGTVCFTYPDGSYPEITTTAFKYEEEHVSKVIKLDTAIEDKIYKYSIDVFHALGCVDYARVDFRLNEQDVSFLEINPLPTLCPGGAFDICAQNQGLSLSDCIRSILEQAKNRYNL